MRRELLIAAGPGEWRAALIEDGVAVELRVERGDGAEAGSIHLGRVVRLLPALGAALVDIGGDRPAFLPQSEILPRGRHLAEGERVLVQIRREAQGGKAARLTTAVALRGSFVELVAGRPGIGGDEKLTPEVRAQIAAKTVGAGPHPPTGAGPSLPRDHGGGLGWGPARPAMGLRLLQPAPIESLAAEAAALLPRWQEFPDRAAPLDPPARLAPAATSAAALAGVLPAPRPHPRRRFRRASRNPRRLSRSGRGAAAATGLAGRSRRAVRGGVVADRSRSPAAARSISTRRAAAVLIDVDSGTPETGSPERTALAVDLAAAAAIGRHIRLRNLGGGIVVDFVGLDDRGARERVRAALAAGARRRPGAAADPRLDPARPSRTGAPAPHPPARRGPARTPPGGALVKTAITVAHEALRALRREERAQPGRAWRLIVAPDVAAALAGEAAGAVRALEQRLGRDVAVAADPSSVAAGFKSPPCNHIGVPWTIRRSCRRAAARSAASRQS